MKKFFFVKKKNDISYHGPSGHVFITAPQPNWAKTQNALLGRTFITGNTHLQ